jgi:DNA replication protein DnaD
MTCDTLTENVSNLESDQIKTQESLGSLKHSLLETNENYVKDKDQLVKAKTNINDQHETASVRRVSPNRLRTIFTECEGIFLSPIELEFDDRIFFCLNRLQQMSLKPNLIRLTVKQNL